MKEKELKKAINRIIAEQFKARRNELKLSMQEMGDYLGVRKSTYHYYEKGTSSMDISTIFAICKKLDLDWQIVLTNAYETASKLQK